MDWNDLSRIPAQASEAMKYQFNIPVAANSMAAAVNVPVSFWRTGLPNIRPFTPPSTLNGSFPADGLAHISFSWMGTFPYIDLQGDSRAACTSIPAAAPTPPSGVPAPGATSSAWAAPPAARTRAAPSSSPART
ncbi:MAG: hypothetical protein R3F43_10890 [bacterium]